MRAAFVAPTATAVPPRRRLHRYDARWSDLFTAEQRRIAAVLATMAVAIEHVGSSAIPGLAGRREIDILVGVRPGAAVDAAVHRLSSLGYRIEQRSPPESAPWALLAKPGGIPVELLMVEHDGALWRRHVGLRDYLRESPARALGYARLKARWAARYGLGTPAYKPAKRQFWARISVSQ